MIDKRILLGGITLLLSWVWVACYAAEAEARHDLVVWLKGEDLAKQQKDGERIAVWPDASGNGFDATSSGDLRPSFKAAGTGGKPVAVFAGAAKANPKVIHKLTLSLKQEWRGASIFVVGTGLQQLNWLGTAPGKIGEIRLIGGLQHCNNPESPSTKLTVPPDGFQIVAVVDGPGKGKAMDGAVFVNGKPAGTYGSERCSYGVVFEDTSLGAYQDWASLKGEIAEVLVYKEALGEADRLAVERYLMAKYGVGDAKGAPAAPPGFPKPQKEKAALPAVKAKPFTANLKLWAKADDIKGLQNNERVGSWPAAMGEALTGEGDGQPRYVEDGMNGRPVVRFQGDKKDKPETNHFLNLPLSGEWKEVTMIFAGRNLNHGGLFDTAPCSAQTLRHIGGLQHCGSPVAVPGFPLVNYLPDRQMVALTLRIDEKGSELTAYGYGILGERKSAEAAAVKQPFAFKKGRLGDVNFKEQLFNGDIAEVFIYDKVLSDAERKQTETYLAEKYGIIAPTKEQAEIARSRYSLTMPRIPNTMTWLQNSFSGVPDAVQTGIFDTCVLPDGTLIAVSVWDEMHKEIGWYKDGKCVPGKGAGGATSAILTDGKFLYAGASGLGKPRAGIKRLDLDGKPAPWSGEKPVEALWFDVPKIWDEVLGLALQSGELFATIKEVSEIKVVDPATGQLKRSLPMDAQPGRIAAGKDGTLWVVVGTSVRQITPDGKATGKDIKLEQPTGLAFDPQGQLAVAEMGARAQIVFYDLSGAQPKETKALGEPGGALGGKHPGLVGEQRLYEVKDIEFDAAGNLYVLGASHMRAYAPDGKMLWQLEATCFCSVGDFDPATDGADIYGEWTHYRHVPGQPMGKDWVWHGVTRRDVHDPSGIGGPYLELRRFDGHLYGISHQGSLLIHKQEPESELFKHMAAYAPGGGGPRAWKPEGAPEKGRWAWSDLNDDGKAQPNEISVPAPNAPADQPSYDLFVDEKGGLWEPNARLGIRYIPAKKFTPGRAPVYDLADEKYEPRPPEFMDVMRVHYFPKTDTMYLSGTTWDHPARGNETWGGCGRECIRYDDWSKPTRRIVSRMVFPGDAWTIRAMSVLHEANRVFAGECATAVVFTYDSTNGKLLGILEPDKRAFGLCQGWIDQSGGVRSFLRKDGEILLLVEDCLYAKQFLYRIPPGATGK